LNNHKSSKLRRRSQYNVGSTSNLLVLASANHKFERQKWLFPTSFLAIGGTQHEAVVM